MTWCFHACNCHFFIKEKKNVLFFPSLTLADSLTCRYSLTEETLRLTGWREVVGSGGYRACCGRGRMRCTECGFWLEFPADPERWASCRSPSASPPPPAAGVLSLLLLYYMGIVCRLMFLCNLFFLLLSYLFLYFVCPFLLYTLSVCNFPFFYFYFLCIFLCCFDSAEHFHFASRDALTHFCLCGVTEMLRAGGGWSFGVFHTMKTPPVVKLNPSWQISFDSNDCLIVCAVACPAWWCSLMLTCLRLQNRVDRCRPKRYSKRLPYATNWSIMRRLLQNFPWVSHLEKLIQNV